MAGIISDGNYTIEVSLSGGSGRADVTSPTKLNVTDGKMQAEIEWSSPYYDYMEVDGKEYYPINNGGNSLFMVDVSELDCEIPVLAETVAMSEPHTIEYTLYFDSSTVKNESDSVTGVILGSLSAVIILAATVAVFAKRKRAK